MRFTLIGGSGGVGQELVPILEQHGHKVRVLGRDLPKLEALFGAEVERVAVELDNKAAVTEALKNTDVAIYLIGVPYNKFKLHPEQLAKALDASEAAGVKHFIHVSNVYPFGLPQKPTLDESHPREPNSFKGRMRKQQEDLVLAAHARGPMKTLIVRPPDYYGPTAENSYVRDIFLAALENRTANVIAPVNTPHDFVYLPDLARAIYQLSEREPAFGTAYNFTGPEPLTTQQFADIVFSQENQPTKLRGVGKFVLRIAGLFSPMMGEVVEMHYLWTTPVLLDDSKFRAMFPHFRKTPHEEAIKSTLAALQEFNKK